MNFGLACCAQIWDFKHVRVLWPMGGFGGPFDTSFVSTFSNVSPVSGPDYDAWSSPPQLTEKFPAGQYLTRTTTRIFGWWDYVSGAWVLQEQAITVTQQALGYFQNPCDTAEAALYPFDTITPIGNSGPNTNSTTIWEDLRLTGFPGATADATHVTVYSGAVFSGTELQPPIFGDLAVWTNEDANQSLMGPPSITATSVTQYFNGPGPMPTAPPDGPIIYLGHTLSTNVTLSDWVPASAVIAEMSAQLNAIPLLGGNVLTREGYLNFRYFQTSCATPTLDNYAAGKTYARDGTCALTVPAFAFMGYQAGANDGPSAAYGSIPEAFLPNNSGILYTSSFAFSLAAGAPSGQPYPGGTWPYQWPDGTISNGSCSYPPPTGGVLLGHNIKAPDWANGYSTIASLSGQPYADTCSFVSKDGNAMLNGGGWHSLPQWSAGTAYAVGNIITNVPNWAGSIADWLKIQCTATTGDNTSDSTEPAWGASPTVGQTFTDNNVTWTILALGAPVTALVTQGSTNRLCIFPIRSGIVITGQDTGQQYYPAENGPMNQYVFAGGSVAGNPDFSTGAFQMAESMVRVPPNPLASSNDPARFQDLGFSGSWVPFPELNLATEGITDLDSVNTVTWFEYKTLSPGEWVFSPGSMNSPTGFGFDQFLPVSGITQSRQAGGGNATTSLGTAGGGSASGEL